MKYQDSRRYEMLVRVSNFAATHAQLFPATSRAHDAFAALATEIGHLDALGVAERSATQATRADRPRAARKALIECLRRLRKTALVLARTTGCRDALIERHTAMDDVALLTVARQSAASAAPHAGQFAAYGVTVEELEQRIADLNGALHHGRMGRDQRTEARARMQASMDRALAAVAVLDVMVANCLRTETAALAVWKVNRRIKPRKRTQNRSIEPDVAPVAIASPLRFRRSA